MLFPSSPARGASSPGDGGGVFVPPELESMLQTTSPKTAKHVLSRAACDALAESGMRIAQLSVGTRVLVQRSEALVVELRAESERLSIRNAELSSQLAQAVANNATLERAERGELEARAREAQAVVGVSCPLTLLLVR